MSDTNTNNDPQKKYWWLLLIVVPILLALIALIPNLLNQEETKKSENTLTPSPIQKADNVGQTTQKGHNINNVHGDISITESIVKDKNQP